MNQSNASIQKTAEIMKQISQKMLKTKQKLLESMERRQKIYKELNLQIFHQNSCFSFEERIQQLENKYIIIEEDDEKLIILDNI